MANPTPEQIAELEEKLKNMSPEELKNFQKNQCIFCQMVDGKVQSKKIYDDKKVIAILDINPANPGHVLIIPKEHYMIMPQIPENEIAYLFNIVKSISQASLRALSAEGTNIIVANGTIAGQRSQHFMIHIIPRKQGDNITFTLPQAQHNEEELEAVREKMYSILMGEQPSKEITVKESQKPQILTPEKKNPEIISKPPEDKPKDKSDEINIDEIAKMFKG